MTNELKQIKKLFGEEMMHTCRELFPTILENEENLLDILLKYFEPSKDLIQDIKSQNKLYEFKEFILCQAPIYQKYTETDKTPEELLHSIGYKLIKVETQEELQKFKKYYKSTELLCTFNSKTRLDRCHVFFLVHESAEKLLRKEFIYPRREDEYGRSVMSVQFSKDNLNTVSIKTRYNHTVVNPDCTYSNNLENIIPGLTYSFKKYYNIYPKESYNSILELEGYEIIKKHYLKVNYQYGLNVIAPDNVIAVGNEIRHYSKNTTLVMDYFILNLHTKKIDVIDSFGKKDGLYKHLQNIKKIEIKNEKEYKIVYIQKEDESDLFIKLDKNNKIIGYYDYYIKDLTNFLEYNRCLKEIITPNVKTFGSHALFLKQNLEKYVFPDNLKSIGLRSFMRTQINNVQIPDSVDNIGIEAFTQSNIKKLKLSKNLKKIERGAFSYNEISTLVIPEGVEVIEEEAFMSNAINELILPKSIKKIEKNAFKNNMITTIQVPKNAKIDKNAFDNFVTVTKTKENIFTKILKK